MIFNYPALGRPPEAWVDNNMVGIWGQLGFPRLGDASNGGSKWSTPI